MVDTYYILYTKIYGQSFRFTARAALTSLLIITWFLWVSAVCGILPILLNYFSLYFCFMYFCTWHLLFLLLHRESGDFQGHLVFKEKQGSASQDPRCTLPPYCYGWQSLETCNSTFTSHPHLALYHTGRRRHPGALRATRSPRSGWTRTSGREVRTARPDNKTLRKYNNE